jgi:hypothetical protein
MFHYRVSPNPDGITNHSSLNIWPKGTAEPAQWTVEADTPARSGSILFDAHEVDVSIGPTISFTRPAVQVGLDQTSGPATLAFCWAHWRRQWFDIAKSPPAPTATEALKRIAELYEIEGETSFK